MTNRSVLAVALAIVTLCSPSMLAQRGGAPPGDGKAKVNIVQATGCVERRAGSPVTWWLTQAAPPVVTRDGVFNTVQVEEAKKSPPGAREFQLVGIADFLDAESLLQSANRAAFTRPDQANATGELKAGRKVLVKGPLIESGGVARINLLAVVGLADGCR